MRFTLIVILLYGCTHSSNTDDLVDNKRLIEVLAKLDMPCNYSCRIIIFPMIGCSACSNQLIDNFCNIDNHELITIIISGNNIEFLKKIKNLLPFNRIILDKSALTTQYGIVSMYPIFINKNQSDQMVKIELKPGDHCSFIALINKAFGNNDSLCY